MRRVGARKPNEDEKQHPTQTGPKNSKSVTQEANSTRFNKKAIKSVTLTLAQTPRPAKVGRVDRDGEPFAD